MGWTDPATVPTGQFMDAAFWNQQVRDNMAALAATGAASNIDDRTFTNTGFLDLDALTGGAGSMGALIVSVVTGTEVLVTVSCSGASATAGIVLLGWRCSGATTLAAASALSARNADTPTIGIAKQSVVTVTAGTNVFEAQASVTAGTGRIMMPCISVVPLF